MPNHFHLLISVKQEKEVLNYLEGLDSSSPFPKLQTLEKLKTQTLEKLVSKQFSNCFSSYTQAFNKQQSRMGSLFMKNFKRKKVHTEEYFRNLVHYIHFNPVEAKFCKYPNDYSYTSYREILKDDSGFLCKKEILEWFGDIESFICFHQNNSPRLR